MKVSVRGTDQVMEVEGSLSVGDILMFISTMAVVKASEEDDNAEVILISTSATGVKTSKLFREVQAEVVDAEATVVELKDDDN